jgi:hypothetical protein
LSSSSSSSTFWLLLPSPLSTLWSL